MHHCSRLFLVVSGMTGCGAPPPTGPSFPGAVGFGAVATGGRGGDVVAVTTLASGGEGSLQAALSRSGRRIVVFRVSGVIEGDHVIEHGDVTIAGQTAPGAGITIAGRLTGAYDADVGNIVIRHLRLRPRYDGTAGEQFDALQLSKNRRLMLDHISVAWGVDETVDLYEARDVTVQYCTIEESAMRGHPEGQHNYGLIHGPDGRRITIHHNLFAHHKNRAPAVAHGPADIRNNVMYDVRHGFVHHNPARGSFDIVGNTFIRGPSDQLIPFWFDDETPAIDPISYHLADNYIDDPGDFVGRIDDPWEERKHGSMGDLYLPSGYYQPTAHDFGADYRRGPTQPPAQARAEVLAEAGAFPRDVVTRRTVSDVKARGGGWGVRAPDDLLAGLQPADAPPDTDGDGIPDEWESDHGLSPEDPQDRHHLVEGPFSALDVYLQERADEVVGAGR